MLVLKCQIDLPMYIFIMALSGYEQMSNKNDTKVNFHIFPFRVIQKRKWCCLNYILFVSAAICIT